MNKLNNKRKKNSKEKIESAFVKLLQEKDVNEIAVTKICKLVKVNRSTFYASYIDIYDLVDKIQETLEEQVFELYKDERENNYNSNDFLKLFKHIKENQLFYKTYFKLGLDGNFKITNFDVEQATKYYNNEHIEYHIEFFKAGFNRVIKLWLKNNCRETPEEIYAIITSEYQGK